MAAPIVGRALIHIGAVVTNNFSRSILDGINKNSSAAKEGGERIAEQVSAGIRKAGPSNLARELKDAISIGMAQAFTGTGKRMAEKGGEDVAKSIGGGVRKAGPSNLARELKDAMSIGIARGYTTGGKRAAEKGGEDVAKSIGGGVRKAGPYNLAKELKDAMSIGIARGYTTGGKRAAEKGGEDVAKSIGGGVRKAGPYNLAKELKDAMSIGIARGYTTGGKRAAEKGGEDVAKSMGEGFKGNIDRFGPAIKDAISIGIARGFISMLRNNKDVQKTESLFNRLSRALQKNAAHAHAVRQAWARLQRIGMFLQAGLGTIVGSIGDIAVSLGALVGAAGAAAASLVSVGAAAAGLGIGAKLAGMALGGVFAPMQKVGKGAGGARGKVKNLKDEIKALREEIQQLGFDLEQALIDEEQALLNLESARVTLLRVQDLPPNNRARQDAEIALKQADLDYRMAKDRVNDLRDALEDAKKKKPGDDDRAGRAGSAGADPYANLTKSQKKFARLLVALKPKLDALKEAVAKGFLPELGKQIAVLLIKNGPELTKWFSGIGVALGDATKSIGGFINSSKGISLLGDLFESANVTIKDTGKAASALLEAILTLFSAARPVTEAFTAKIVELSEEFRDLINQTSQDGRLQEFFAGAQKKASMFGSIGANVMRLFNGYVLDSMKPGSGADILLRWLDKVTKQWSAFRDVAKDGIPNQKMRDSAINFTIMADTAGEFLGIFKDLAGDPNIRQFWIIIREGVDPLRQYLTIGATVAPIFAEVLVNIMKIVATFADLGALTAFFTGLRDFTGIVSAVLEIPVVKKFMELFAPITGYLLAFGAAIKVITYFRYVLQSMLAVVLGPMGILITLLGLLGIGFMKAKEQAASTGETITQVIHGWIEALPEVINRIAEAIPKIVDKIVEAVPLFAEAVVQVIQGLVLVLTKSGPDIVEAIFSVINILISSLATLTPVFTTAIMNILSALIKLVVDLAPTIITALIDGLLQMIPAILEALPIIVDALINLVLSLADALVKGIDNLIEGLLRALPDILDALMAALPAIITALVSLITKLAEALPALIVTLIEGLLMAIPIIISTILKILPVLISAFITIILALATAIIPHLPVIVESLLKIVPLLITELVAALPLIIDAAIMLILGLIEGITMSLPLLVEALVRIAPMLVIAIIKMIPALFAAMANVMEAMFMAIPNAWPEIKKKFGKIKDKLVDSAKDIITDFKDVGKRLMEGLWDGINGVQDWLRGKLKIVTNKLPKWVKSFLGIKSPSRVFAEIGQNVGAGLAEGILSTENLVKKAAETIAETATTAASIALTAPEVDSSNLAQGLGSLSGGGILSDIARAGQRGFGTIGENGLSTRDQAIVNAMGASGAGINIVVNPSPGMDEKELAAIVSRRLAFEMRRGAIV